MTVDQAVQYAYMVPDIFRQLSSVHLKLLSEKIKNELMIVNRDCPQSQRKDLLMYQYKYTLKVIYRFVNFKKSKGNVL